MWQKIKEWGSAFDELFFPRRCAVCGKLLRHGEKVLCLACDMDLPRTNYHLQPENPVERLFWGRMPIERATSYFLYTKGSKYRLLLYRLKYKGEQRLGVEMGRMMALELKDAGFFEGIDCMIPVPLHPSRLRQRGYNQSECIVKGLAAVTGIPIDTRSLSRSKATATQTHKSAYERWANVEGIFCLKNREWFRGKHILLVDDVLTTGATTTACADAFVGVPDLKISVLTLAQSVF